MKLNKIAKNAVNIIKDEPINIEEKVEHLEKHFNRRIAHFEDSMATVHSIIIKMSEESIALKEENVMLKKMMSSREHTANSLLDGIKQRVVEPIMKEGQDLAELVFEKPIDEDDHEVSQKDIKIKKHTAEPETEFDKYKKNKDPVPQMEEKSAPNAKEKTVKWMRQRLGLSPQIQDKTSKAKSKKAKKK
ncbi:MAG: hypothetical protein HY831_03995 [Candidatus Aenigmarchaeota archaeon]|nr:hypothetical protein [Candidatus Aenigmarchaeota archaeon]